MLGSGGRHTYRLCAWRLVAREPRQPALLLTALAVAAATALAGAGTAAAATNGRIAFVSNRDGDNEIYILRPDGTGLLKLTDNSADDQAPSWSPDSSQIVFRSDRTGDNEIYVMSANGSGQTQLTFDPASNTDPTWSPDGSRIAFVREIDPSSGDFDLMRMNADGSGVVNLTASPGLDADPSWSPDGSAIAFRSARTGDQEIFATDPFGRGPFNLTQSPAFIDSFPDWSPDGSRIAFERRPSNRQFDIWTMNADGSAQAPLVTTSGTDRMPGWSPDGGQIAFSSTQTGNAEIYTTSSEAGGVLARLTDDPGSDTAPDWGADCNVVSNPVLPDADSDGIADSCDQSNGSLAPVVGETAVLRVKEGQVFVRYPTGKGPTPFAESASAAHIAQLKSGPLQGFVPLSGAATIPMGSIINTQQGRISITSAADRQQHTQTADFYDGVFTLRQDSSKRPTTELRLRSLPYRTSCGPATGSARASASKRRLARLWGSGKGRFRTRGRFSAAAVRGTRWLTVERCDGTLTQVTTGKVTVFERATGRRVTVTAGHAYLARATQGAIRNLGLR